MHKVLSKNKKSQTRIRTTKNYFLSFKHFILSLMSHVLYICVVCAYIEENRSVLAQSLSSFSSAYHKLARLQNLCVSLGNLQLFLQIKFFYAYTKHQHE